MEFSRQEYWSGLPFPPLGDLPNPEVEPASLGSPALLGRFFTTVNDSLPGKTLYLRSPIFKCHKPIHHKGDGPTPVPTSGVCLSKPQSTKPLESEPSGCLIENNPKINQLLIEEKIFHLHFHTV